PYVSATYLIFSSNPEIRATKREGLPGPLTRQIRGPPGGVDPGPGPGVGPAGPARGDPLRQGHLELLRRPACVVEAFHGQPRKGLPERPLDGLEIAHLG